MDEYDDSEDYSTSVFRARSNTWPLNKLDCPLQNQISIDEPLPEIQLEHDDLFTTNENWNTNLEYGANIDHDIMAWDSIFNDPASAPTPTSHQHHEHHHHHHHHHANQSIRPQQTSKNTDSPPTPTPTAQNNNNNNNNNTQLQPLIQQHLRQQPQTQQVATSTHNNQHHHQHHHQHLNQEQRQQPQIITNNQLLQNNLHQSHDDLQQQQHHQPHQPLQHILNSNCFQNQNHDDPDEYHARCFHQLSLSSTSPSNQAQTQQQQHYMSTTICMQASSHPQNASECISDVNNYEHQHHHHNQHQQHLHHHQLQPLSSSPYETLEIVDLDNVDACLNVKQNRSNAENDLQHHQNQNHTLHSLNPHHHHQHHHHHHHQHQQITLLSSSVRSEIHLGSSGADDLDVDLDYLSMYPTAVLTAEPNDVCVGNDEMMHQHQNVNNFQTLQQTQPLETKHQLSSNKAKQQHAGNLSATTPGNSAVSGAPSGKVNGKLNAPRRNAWGNTSYADLISQAINSTEDKRLTLSQIYDWMVQHVPYFKDKGDTNSSAGWKNSVRHNLSLHNRFKRIQNEGTGKSSWWTINPETNLNKCARRRAASMEASKYEKKRRGAKKKADAIRSGLLSYPSLTNVSFNMPQLSGSLGQLALPSYSSSSKANKTNKNVACGNVSSVGGLSKNTDNKNNMSKKNTDAIDNNFNATTSLVATSTTTIREEASLLSIGGKYANSLEELQQMPAMVPTTVTQHQFTSLAPAPTPMQQDDNLEAALIASNSSSALASVPSVDNCRFPSPWMASAVGHQCKGSEFVV